MLLSRDKVGSHGNGEPIYEERWLEQGQVASVPKVWAEKLAARTIEGYPGANGSNSVGEIARVFSDSPIEILERAA